MLKMIEQKYLRTDIPDFRPGDNIKVYVKIKEGDKERIQVFQGDVVALKGKGINGTFTVRKLSSGIGVERIFPLHSPNITKIQKVKEGKVRRSKLYYLRDRQGKQARIDVKAKESK